MRLRVLMLALILSISGCGGGSGGSEKGVDVVPAACSGNCVSTESRLTVSDVQTIIAQAVNEALAQNVSAATIAVVDRVGNVLGVFRVSPGVAQQVVIASALDANGNPLIAGGLEGIRLPVTPAPVRIDDQAAIAKAVTGAYLSSEGNAFSSRTAGQIVQENFNPGELNQPSGPLFGVQFSQLACSDFTSAFNGIGPGIGPQRSPLGLSADPGGFPLYKAGVPVGAVGVIADGQYGLDKVISDEDRDLDEMIAFAATFGYAAPVDRRADQITVDGKTFRFSDVGFGDLARDPATAPLYSSIDGAVGTEVAVTGYFGGTLQAGTIFGTLESGIRPDGDVDYPGRDAFVFVDAANALRFPPRAGTDGATNAAPLSAAEVRSIIDSALAVANRARAQIRRPLGSQARVTVSVVDTDGEILAMARTRDAPVFGADVSLQKARTATFFSSATAADFLRSLPPATYLETTDSNVGVARLVPLESYVIQAQNFLANPTALEDGATAFSDRAGGNLSRPFFPDGLRNRPSGPFSKPQGEWSVFSTGLQLDLSINSILQHVLFTAGAFPADVDDSCAGIALSLTTGGSRPQPTSGRLANGLQIFPGSVPIYRDNVLVGGIGVSGDGIDQDDMIAFLGLHNAGVDLGGAVNNAPVSMRADNLEPQGTRLRYVQCPQSPFLQSNEQNVCQGK